MKRVTKWGFRKGEPVTCVVCEVDMEAAFKVANLCHDCVTNLRRIDNWRKGAIQGMVAVRAAIIRGALEHPKALMCTDCGVPATCYDHRDYNRPLSVEAVCSSCNVQRGAAIPKTGYVLNEVEVRRRLTGPGEDMNLDGVCPWDVNELMTRRINESIEYRKRRQLTESA